MILILSDETDSSTDAVIDWILTSGKKFIRINNTSKLRIKKIQHIEHVWQTVLEYEGYEINFQEITAYWYRRGNLNIETPQLNIFSELSAAKEVEQNLSQEIKDLKYFLHYLLQCKKSIGSYLENDINKLVNLDIAFKCGLKIPETFISSKYSSLQSFFDQKNSCVTKAISDTIFISDNNHSLLAYTNIVASQDIQGYRDFTFPSLLQDNIDKKYELRIFYLDGEFYPMAIFSQADQQTKNDFRNYNFQRPNRQVPYKLPSQIQKCLKNFMEIKSLKSGSIDMIVSDKDEYFFLEVNPVGQYGMTSIPCNYHLDYKIAQYLCN